MSAEEPVVAIVGRPNVGKSAVFNRLVGQRIAIVHDQPGVTRDRITAICTTGSFPFTIVDTGGIGGGADEAFAEMVQTEAEIAIETADVIVFVVDSQDGVVPADEWVAGVLRRTTKPIILAVNKVDHDSHINLSGDFARLGFSEIVPLSAAHGRGLNDLIDRLVRHLEAAGFGPRPSDDQTDVAVKPESPLRLAIVGRPNAGKSSLINAILKDDRTIVSDIAGTTRDAVDIPYERDGQRYILIDTAGIRPKTKRDTSVEVFSAMRTEKSIHRAHLCALVIDAADGVRVQDRRIARMILEANRPCIVVMNKFDLYHPDGRFRDRLDELEAHVREQLFFLHYAPLVAVSALKRDFISQVFKAIDRVRSAARRVPNTGALNRLLEQAMTAAPPPASKGGTRLKLLYATLTKNQVETPLPIPRIVLFVNKRSLLSDTYGRYLENEIRKHSPLTGLPIRFDIRERSPRKR